VDWTDVAQYEKVMSVNFIGVVRMSKAVLGLLKSSGGRLVNVASMDGLRPLPGISAYTSSKHAVDAFTRSLAMEMDGTSTGVKAIVVNPGTFSTTLSRSGSSAVRRTFAGAPCAVREEYGEDYARTIEDYVAQFMNNIPSSARPVGDAILDAVATCVPQRRYVVGLDARLFWKPLRDFVPEDIFDGVVGWVLSMALPARASKPHPPSVAKIDPFA
jgi:NAD(P)-dependent dehydrogenase (short-subunit alcohol dehydrogenase family)